MKLAVRVCKLPLSPNMSSLWTSRDSSLCTSEAHLVDCVRFLFRFGAPTSDTKVCFSFSSCLFIVLVCVLVCGQLSLFCFGCSLISASFGFVCCCWTIVCLAVMACRILLQRSIGFIRVIGCWIQTYLRRFLVVFSSIFCFRWPTRVL